MLKLSNLENNYGLVNEDGKLVNKYGHLVNEEGYLVNEDGHLVVLVDPNTNKAVADAKGNPIENSSLDNAIDNLVDEEPSKQKSDIDTLLGDLKKYRDKVNEHIKLSELKYNLAKVAIDYALIVPEVNIVGSPKNIGNYSFNEIKSDIGSVIEY